MNMDKNFEPEYAHWMRFDSWNLSSAICLLLNYDPDKFGKMDALLKSEYDRLMVYAENNFGHSLPFINDHTYIEISHSPLITDISDYGEVAPVQFIDWAKSKGLDLPSPLSIDNEILQASKEPLSVLRETSSWKSLELLATKAIDKFPGYKQSIQNKPLQKEKLKEWLQLEIKCKTREAEIIQKALSDIFKI